MTSFSQIYSEDWEQNAEWKNLTYLQQSLSKVVVNDGVVAKENSVIIKELNILPWRL
jgi:hypothetical protein